MAWGTDWGWDECHTPQPSAAELALAKEAADKNSAEPLPPAEVVVTILTKSWRQKNRRPAGEAVGYHLSVERPGSVTWTALRRTGGEWLPNDGWNGTVPDGGNATVVRTETVRLPQEWAVYGGQVVSKIPWHELRGLEERMARNLRHP